MQAFAASALQNNPGLLAGIGTNSAATTTGTATTSAPSLPSGLIMYGTDSSGNPIYVDVSNGDLFNAYGQQIGSIATNGTAPTSAAPTLSGVSVPGQAPGTSLAAGTAPLPAGSGPSSGPSGPIIPVGSSNPFGNGNPPYVDASGTAWQTTTAQQALYGNLLGSGSTSTTGSSSGRVHSTLSGITAVSPIIAQIATALAATPVLQTGGAISQTGLAVVESGETVIPPSGSVGASATNQATVTLNAAKVSTEQQVSSIASNRIGMEMKLLQMKQQQNQNDLDVLNKYQQVMSAISSGNFSGVSGLIGGASSSSANNSIEDSLYNLYQQRGRYGEGGIAGQYP